MADELRDVPTGDDDTAALTHPLTRIVVLPFRMLRADPGNRFSGLQPAGCDHDVARGHRLAGRALERHGGAICQRDARLQGAGRRSRRRSRGQRHDPARRRRTARARAARRSAGRHRDHVALDPGAARRSLSAPGRPRAPHRRGAGAATGRRDRVAVAGCAGQSRAPTSCICAATRLGRAYSGVVEARDLYERSVALDPTLRARRGRGWAAAIA